MYQLRSTQLSTARMKPFRRKPMSNQAIGIKFHGQRRLMTFDALAMIALSTRLCSRASHGRTPRSIERRSCRITSPSLKEVRCAAVLTCQCKVERMQQATSIDKKAVLVQSKRVSQTRELSQTHIGRVRKSPRLQKQIKAIIAARRSSILLR